MKFQILVLNLLFVPIHCYCHEADHDVEAASRKIVGQPCIDIDDEKLLIPKKDVITVMELVNV